MYELDGQVALITGAGGEQGIGRAIALRLAKEGADLVVNDIVKTPYSDSDWRGLSDLVDEIKAMGRRAISIVADVGDETQVKTMVSEALTSMGRIDILVNNAGTLAGRDRVPVVELDVAAWDQVQRVNLRGTFLCSQAVSRHMIERKSGGRIINISSISGKKGTARFAAYNASKFAVIGFTQALASELGSSGITVNSICPGLVDTERLPALSSALLLDIDPEDRQHTYTEKAKASIPLGRLATPLDVANTAAFLASKEANYLTGIALTVAGGMYMG